MFLLITLFFSSCGNSDQKSKVLDTSNIQLTLETHRFDKELFGIDTNNIEKGLQQLALKYPDFLNFYLDTIQGFGLRGNYSDTSAAIREGLKVFLTYKDFKELEDSICSHFPDTKDLDDALNKQFRLMKYYFPSYHIPKIMYVTLGLKKLPAFTIDNNIAGICLDMFLEEKYPYYASVGIPAYMAPHLRRSYIPVALFKAIYTNEHPFKMEENTLLDLIIQRGKEQYFLHKILTDVADSVIFGISGDQVNWCYENEGMIYNFFIQQNLLYSKDAGTVMSYVNDGPFSPGLPVTGKIKQTPGNIGSWLGYRIVSTYMDRHPNMTLSALLMQKNDPAKFLEEAKYRPAK